MNINFRTSVERFILNSMYVSFSVMAHNDIECKRVSIKNLQNTVYHFVSNTLVPTESLVIALCIITTDIRLQLSEAISIKGWTEIEFVN